jgi:hypothetical protein
MQEKDRIELVNITGTPILSAELAALPNILAFYQGRLLQITSKQLLPLEGPPIPRPHILEPHRFVVANTPAERDLLLKVEPVEILLRDHQMRSEVVQVNPYQSVGWLRGKAEEQQGQRVKMVVNEEELTDDRSSLLQHINENAIVHVLSANP